MNTIYSEDYIEIITRLRTARNNLGITQQDLANKLNIRQSIISKVENCERKLDIIEFLLWTQALNVSWKKILPRKYLEKMGEENGD